MVLDFQKKFNQLSKKTGSTARLVEDGKLGEQTASAKNPSTSLNKLINIKPPVLTDVDAPVMDKEDLQQIQQQQNYENFLSNPANELSAKGYLGNRKYDSNTMYEPWTSNLTTSTEADKSSTKKKGKFDLESLLPYANQALEYLRPSNVEDFDYRQLYPEMMSLAMNQPEGIRAQFPETMYPELGSYISFDSRLNQITSQARAAQRMAGSNPAAQAMIAAQANAAKDEIKAQELATNQQRFDEQRNKIVDLYNASQREKYGIASDLAEKRLKTLSTAKAQQLEAAKSISTKLAQQQLENRNLAIMENLYNFRFDPVTGRAINMNPLAKFNMEGSGGTGKGALASGLEFTYDAAGNIVGVRKEKDTTAKYGKKIPSKNSSIVKAMKNL